MMWCKYCGKKIKYDLENDLIHPHLEDKGFDARMCDPSNPDSTIATKEGRGGGFGCGRLAIITKP